MLWRALNYVFMDEANAGEGGEGGGSASAPAGAEGGSADNASGTSKPGEGGVLASAAAVHAPQGIPASIPEKYQVKKDDGTLDIEASSLKLAEAYGHLEKRMGSGDVPPKTVGDYQIAVPDALKDVWNPAQDEKLQGFLGEAHKLGMTQAQIDLVMKTHHEVTSQIVAGDRKLSEDECAADLRNDWKTDQQFKEGVSRAYKALTNYAGDDAESILRDHGNDPRLIRLLSRVGGELSEDKSINPGGTLPGGVGVESLMTSEAYSNPKHPDHARVSAQVQAFFAKQADAAARAGNAPLM